MRLARGLIWTLFMTLVLAFAGAKAQAQSGAQSGAQMASLVADEVAIVGTGLVAEGNVVVIFEGVRLTARRIRFDDATGQLTIDGPITLRDGSDTIFLADGAQLSADLKNGLLQSARLVLNQQLQIAAAEINRVDGRYTQLTKVVASSCQVCINRPVPLWAIRASRVIHDTETRQLYFQDAQLRFMDIPVFYLPRLRLPDPSVTRATGFLPPRLRSNSQIGVGLRVPYFLTLGDHADVTLTPFISEVSKALELRYRQAFRHGDISFEGAVARDKILPGTTRYYLFGEGNFDLPQDFKLRFNLEQMSDPSILSDYGYSDRDRLRNGLEINRARRNQYVFAEIGRWETLRADELPIADQLPGVQGDFLFEQRLHPRLIGGEVQLRFSAQGHLRPSGLDVLGRDQTRAGIGASWQRDWLFGNGMIASAEAAFSADFFQITDDAAYLPDQTRTSHGVGVSLAWPLSRQLSNGAVDVLEPIIALAYTGQTGPDAPNEDSLMVEFDTANLFDLSRFPGSDAIETGLRANLGVTWTRVNPEGLSFTLAAGKVFRLQDMGQFSNASGLNGVSSDWLIAGQVRLSDRLFLQSRALFADDFSVTKAETLAAWHGQDFSLALGHVWVIADPAENRPDPVQEWTLDTAYQINDYWAASFDAHFDAVAGKATHATLGLEYKNECISVDLSLSRRFTSSGSVTPTTGVSFGVNLLGFGAGSSGRAQSCAQVN